jgi:hypothetical protein
MTDESGALFLVGSLTARTVPGTDQTAAAAITSNRFAKRRRTK